MPDPGPQVSLLRTQAGARACGPLRGQDPDRDARAAPPAGSHRPRPCTDKPMMRAPAGSKACHASKTLTRHALTRTPRRDSGRRSCGPAELASHHRTAGLAPGDDLQAVPGEGRRDPGLLSTSKLRPPARCAASRSCLAWSAPSPPTRTRATSPPQQPKSPICRLTYELLRCASTCSTLARTQMSVQSI